MTTCDYDFEKLGSPCEAHPCDNQLLCRTCQLAGQQRLTRSSADRKTGKPPARGEFVVRNAYLVTMDAKLGDIPSGDLHVRNGSLVAVGPNLNAPGAEEIDGRNRIALPGFVDTHFHLWGSFARGIVADGDFDYFSRS